MDDKLEDRLKKVSENIVKQIGYVETEEATKTAFVLPFLTALGYDVFDLMEVVPEFTADFNTKKGKKVDYAIMKGGKPIILVECKLCTCDLDINDMSQLSIYFTETEARFGVLTNGIIYQFYTDIEQPNKMDKKPFFEINMLEVKEDHVNELKKFTKTGFKLDELLKSVSDLKYITEMEKIMGIELTKPSDEFIHFFAKKVYSKSITKKTRLKFKKLTKTAVDNFIKNQVNAKLKTALDNISSMNHEEESEVIDKSKSAIFTTEDEWEGYYIVRAMLHEVIDIDRVFIKDTVNYCGILLDDNNRKPICRLHFNNPNNRRISLFDSDRKEERISIDNLKDIYNYSDRLKATIKLYEKEEKTSSLEGYALSNLKQVAWSKNELLSFLDSCTTYQTLFLTSIIKSGKLSSVSIKEVISLMNKYSSQKYEGRIKEVTGKTVSGLTSGFTIKTGNLGKENIIEVYRRNGVVFYKIKEKNLDIIKEWINTSGF